MAVPDTRDATVAAFRRDAELFDTVGQKLGRHFRDLQKRSVFNQIAVQQLRKVLEAVDWRGGHGRMQNWLRKRGKSLHSSYLAEEAFQRQRSAESSGRNKRVADVRKHDILLSRRLISQVNRMVEIEPMPPQPSPSIGTHVFRVNHDKAPEWFRDIATTSSKPSWHSPSAASSAKRVADMALCEHLDERDDWDSLSDAWWVLLLRGTDILIRRVGEAQWHFALGDVCEVAGLGWPAEMKTLGMQQWAIPCGAGTSLDWVFVTRPSDFEAIEYKWRSPYSQAVIANSLGVPPFSHCVACQLRGEAAPLLTLAARCAFWKLPLSAVQAIATRLGVALNGATKLYGVLEALVVHILGIEGAELLEIMARRIAREALVADESVLEDFDDVFEIMGKSDKKAVEGDKEARERSDRLAEEYRQDHSARQDIVRQAHERAGNRTRTARRARPGAGLGVMRSRALPQGDIPQAEIAPLCAPGHHVWKDNVRRRWHIHPVPHARTSFSWLEHTERGAAVEALRHGWRMWLSDNDMLEGQCPIQGLFIPPSGDGGASSSGLNGAAA